MGVFRLLLAVAVVLQHAGALWGFQPLGSAEAVESFFMISGFYMAMILTEKYRGPRGKRLFWSNRFLRLYPLYWAVACVTLGCWITVYLAHRGNGPLHYYKLVDLPGVLVLALANVVIFGQDLLMFTGANAQGHLYLTADCWGASIETWRMLLVPQAWSLGTELIFYVVAPFLVRRSTLLLSGIVVASLALRASLFFGLGLRGDPWTYRFFPTEISFFLLGSLAYRVYVRLPAMTLARPVQPVIAGLLFAAFFAYQFLPSFAPGGVAWKPWGFFCLAWIGIPSLFSMSKHSRLDRYVGELSYPVYIAHELVVVYVGVPLTKKGWVGSTPAIVLALSILSSLFLVHSVSAPIERLRRRRVQRALGIAATAETPFPGGEPGAVRA